MISIKPEWVAKILNGEKTIEIRKTKPSCQLPCKVYIYCTIGNELLACTFPMNYIANGKVVAEFILNKVTALNQMPNLKRTGLILSEGAMDMGQFNNYGGRYAWHIDDLKIYTLPKHLSSFYKINDYKNSFGFSRIKRPPQSWCYVEELEGAKQ